MKGKILNYEKGKGVGIISTENGERYSFDVQQWKEKSSIERGMSVDFEISSEGFAKEIFLLDDNKAIKKGWFEKMSLMEKYFWGTILVLAVLYIIAEILAYINTNSISKNRIDDPISNPAPPVINISSHQKIQEGFGKKEINKNLDLKINAFYNFTNQFITKKSIKQDNIQKTLTLVHSEFLTLLKEHALYVDKNMIDTKVNDKIINKIYNDLKDSQVISNTKKEITLYTFRNMDTVEDFKHQLNNIYRKRFDNSSREIYSIFLNEIHYSKEGK